MTFQRLDFSAMSLEDDVLAPRGARRTRHGTGRARLAEVAALAGVSTATVSRVFNAPEKVSPDVRERVLTSAAQLDWIPNAAGRALASSRTHIIGAIIPTLDDEIFAAQIAGLQATLTQQGLTLFLGCSNYDPALALEETRAMLARGVEALVLVGEDHPPELFEALHRQRLPYVVTYAWRAESPHPCIGFDNHAAFARLTQHLLSLGHRRFGVIHQPLAHNDRVQARLAGIRETLASAGIDLPVTAVYECPATIEAGIVSTHTLLTSGPPPTALICGNDRLAMGALFAARRLGLEVPKQLSITGFDDLELVSHLQPALTTLRIDNRAIGVATAKALLRARDGEPLTSCELQPEFKLRDTTAPPPSPLA